MARPSQPTPRSSGIGARTAVVTTRGFRDILEIGRGNRTVLYDFKHTRPKPLVPRSRVFEVDERILCDGSVHRPLDEAQVDAIGRRTGQHRA